LKNILRTGQLRDPLSRRDLIGLASAGGLLAFPGSLAFGASDFWNKKLASDWSVAEVEQLKTKSPWAKKVRGEMSASRPAAGSGGGGRGGGRGAGALGTADDSVSSIGGGNTGGMEGGGRGGRGGGDTAGPPGVEGPEVVIRWENAKPLLDATKLKLPPALDNHYAVSITGLPPEMIAAFGRGGGRGRLVREGQTPQPDASEDPAARQKAMIDRIKAAASLTVKGKDPLTADLLLQTMDKQTMIFGFPKEALPLAAADKEVVFTLKLTAIFKVKFELKEMMYGGQLAV
jgi:hypothetical protein